MNSGAPKAIDHLLPSNATLFERVLAAATGTRLRDIPVPLKLLGDPYTVPVAFLDHLAFEVGVDIWHDEWSEARKREVIDITIRTKPILGTTDGIAAYIGLEGGSLVATLTPPQTPFLSNDSIASTGKPTPLTIGTSYIGSSRLEMSPFEAEMLVDANETIPAKKAVIGRFVGACFVAKQDDTKRTAILKSIELSKSGRDRVYVDFQTTRPISFGDAPVMDGSFSLDQRLTRHRL